VKERRERDGEHVLTVEDYYDGPESGYALHNGIPHHFRRDPDVVDDDTDFWLLSPVSEEVASLARESQAIWLRWRDAYLRGEADGNLDSSLPRALPNEKERYCEIEALLKAALEDAASSQFWIQGTFITNPDAPRGWVNWVANLKVVWGHR
jgi:hypothetical protein